MKMYDRNGKEITKNSIVSFYPHRLLGDKTEIWVSKIYDIKDGSSSRNSMIDVAGELVLCNGYYRNPWEVTVITESKAFLIMLEHPTGKHKV